MIEVIKLTIIAYVFCRLGDPGMIYSFYQKLIGRLPDWLFFPLGGCFKCFTGQVLCWYFLINKTPVFDLMFYVASGIFLSMIINWIWETSEK
jgi:drug/metabolite transporter (DMT)-like permease